MLPPVWLHVHISPCTLDSSRPCFHLFGAAQTLRWTRADAAKRDGWRQWLRSLSRRAAADVCGFGPFPFQSAFPQTSCKLREIPLRASQAKKANGEVGSNPGSGQQQMDNCRWASRAPPRPPARTPPAPPALPATGVLCFWCCTAPRCNISCSCHLFSW